MTVKVKLESYNNLITKHNKRDLGRLMRILTNTPSYYTMTLRERIGDGVMLIYKIYDNPKYDDIIAILKIYKDSVEDSLVDKLVYTEKCRDVKIGYAQYKRYCDTVVFDIEVYGRITYLIELLLLLKKMFPSIEIVPV